MKPITRLLMILFLLLVFPLFWSCELIAVTSVESRVISAASGTTQTGVAGVSITLSGSGGAYRTTSDSAGYWFLSSVPAGTYILTAERTGWFFPPLEVVVDPWRSPMPFIHGVPLSGADAHGLSFMLTWGDGVRDLDLHLTAPTSDLSFSGDSFHEPRATTAQHWHSGFGPATKSNRVQIYHGLRAYPSTSAPSIYLLQDHTGYGGAEVIGLRRIPFNAASGSSTRPISPTHTNGLANLFPGSSALTYRWMGVMELYASGLPRHPHGADVRVHVFQTNPGGLTARYLGSFLPPATVVTGTSSMIRINFFLDSQGYEVFQLVADQSTIYPGTSGILSGGHASTIGVRGIRPDQEE